MKLSANQFRTPLAVPKGNDLTEQVKSDSHCIYMEKTKQKLLPVVLQRLTNCNICLKVFFNHFPFPHSPVHL